MYSQNTEYFDEFRTKIPTMLLVQVFLSPSHIYFSGIQHYQLYSCIRGRYSFFSFVIGFFIRAWWELFSSSIVSCSSTAARNTNVSGPTASTYYIPLCKRVSSAKLLMYICSRTTQVRMSYRF